jgi:hypothetical protein
MSQSMDLIEEQIETCKGARAEELEGFIEGYKNRLREMVVERAWLETCVLIAERELAKRD